MRLSNVVSTLEFDAWLEAMTCIGKAKVLARIRNMQLGNLGPCEPVGDGVTESKIDWGPGVRLYFVVRSGQLVILLCGGDKSTQAQDIARAKALAGTV